MVGSGCLKMSEDERRLAVPKFILGLNQRFPNEPGCAGIFWSDGQGHRQRVARVAAGARSFLPRAQSEALGAQSGWAKLRCDGDGGKHSGHLRAHRARWAALRPVKSVYPRGLRPARLTREIRRAGRPRYGCAAVRLQFADFLVCKSPRAAIFPALFQKSAPHHPHP